MSFHCSPKGTLEIRIFPLVEDMDDLLWRADLLRYILEFKNSNIQEVFNEIFLREDSYLYNHLKLKFTPRKILTISKLFSKFAKEIDDISVVS